MVRRFAIIANGVVTNVVAADSGFASSQGWIAAPDRCERGWLYNGTDFTPVAKAIPVPSAITRYQFKQALLDLNSDRYSQLLTYIGTLPEGEQLQWKERRIFLRNSDLINNAAAALNVSSNAVDQLFRNAAEIED